MTRKWVAWLLFLFLLTPLFPTASLAIDEGPVYIGKTQLTAANPKYESWRGEALFDAEKNVLYLHELHTDEYITVFRDIEIVYEGDVQIRSIGRSAIDCSKNASITAATPTSTLTLHTAADPEFAPTSTLYVSNQLVLNGGNLKLSSGMSHGLMCANLAVNGTNLTTSAAISAGVFTLNNGQFLLSSATLWAGGMVVNGGYLSTTGSAVGIHCPQLTMNGGQLSASGVMRAIFADTIKVTAPYRFTKSISSPPEFREPGNAPLDDDTTYCSIDVVKALCKADNATRYCPNFETAWQTAQNASTPATIVLLADYELPYPYTITAGKDITLDLNGHTIDAAQFSMEPGIFTVQSDGSFTLTDSSTTDFSRQGKLSGGNKQVTDQLLFGGAVQVEPGGTFVMDGGVLTDNISTSGGAVYNGGTFIMNGGTIINNIAFEGGGVFNFGTFQMNGGEIIGNKAATAGGVFHAGGSCTLQGNAVISGNVLLDDDSANNLYLDWDDIGNSAEGVTFAIGTMSKNAKVYLTAKKQPESTETPVAVSVPGAVVAPSNLPYFHSDNPQYCIQLWQDGRLYLNEHFYSKYQIDQALVSAPTCTQDAVYAVSCESCGRRLDELFTAEGTALQHTWLNRYLSENADAETHYDICTRCGEHRNSTAHIWNQPTATEEEDKHCTVCGYVAQAASAHTHKGTLVAGSAATCTAMGAKSYYTCRCGKFFQDAACTHEIADIGAWLPIPAAGHQWTGDYLKENADGDKHYHRCTICGEPDPGQPHTWNVVTATLETDKHCIHCSYVAEPKLVHSHTGTFIPEVPATCGADGIKAYYLCDCGMCFEDAACSLELTDFGTWKVIPAKDHAWSETYPETDSKMHYHVCLHCGQSDTGETHIWLGTDADSQCTICGYIVPSAPDIPKTGDDSRLTLWFMLLLVSGAGILLLQRLQRKASR